MICPKCGQEAFGRFCSNCGALLPAEQPGVFKDREEDVGENEGSQAGRDLPDGFQSDESARRGSAYGADEAYDKREEKRGGGSRRKDKAKSRGKQSSGGGKAEAKAKNKLEKRIASLENEIKQENARKARQERRDRQQRGGEESENTEGNVAEAVSKGVVGVIVLASRLMQLFCGLLMAAMVWIMAGSFWDHQGGLGYIETMMDESNYGLALYLGAAGVSLSMGVIWCLWILSKKAAGGTVRLKKYDTGRGFVPFLLCAAVIFAASRALPLAPTDPEAWQGMARGAKAALEAIASQKQSLLFCSVCGAVLSLVRKVLRV